MKLKHSVAVVFIATVFLTGVASAASVSWNTVIQPGICQPTTRLYSSPVGQMYYYGTPVADTGDTLIAYTCLSSHVSNPNVTVNYHAQIVNENTGSIVPPHGTISAGTPIRIEAVPHVSSDISWFGTAGYYDSPYGDWVENPSTPPPIQCREKDIIASESWGFSNHVELNIAPPEKTISGISALNCSSSYPARCVPLSAGSFNPEIQFSSTRGNFYQNHNSINQTGGFGRRNSLSYKGCVGPKAAMWDINNQGTPYILNVPTQTIPYPITVTDSPNAGPAIPNISASGQCLVDAPFSISFSSTDPDGDTLRYLIDWDNDASADQIVPPSGYVPSGTVETASRTYSLPGLKQIKVMAEDSKGGVSAWKTFAFECTSAPVAEDGNGGADDSGGGTSLPPSATLSIRAIPSLVRQNEQTTIRWEASGVSACSITGSNGDALPAIGSALPYQGEAETSPIASRTTYILSCAEEGTGNTETASATVNILPVFQEQ